MKRRTIYALGAVALVGALVLSTWSASNRFHAKCDTLALASDLEARLEIRVPRSQIEAFNDRLVSYLNDSGYTFETSHSADYLSPPDAEGRQTRFHNFKTIGCTYRSIIWSENVISEEQFTITVHKTAFGSKISAGDVASDLERLLLRVPEVTLIASRR